MVEETDTDTALTRLCLGDVTVAAVDRRPTKAEDAFCERNRVEPLTVLVAHGAVALRSAPELEIQCLESGELRRLWRAGSGVESYDELAPRLPAHAVALFAPSLTLSTDDFFSAKAVGREGDLRRDIEFAEDHSQLRRALARERAALAFDDLEPGRLGGSEAQPVAVDAGEGCVKPTATAVQAGRYPLAGPLYLVVASEELEREPVERMLKLALGHSDELTGYPGVISLIDAEERRQLARVEAVVTAEDERE